jgi:hypothetical protein
MFGEISLGWQTFQDDNRGGSNASRGTTRGTCHLEWRTPEEGSETREGGGGGTSSDIPCSSAVVTKLISSVAIILKKSSMEMMSTSSEI